MTDNQNSIIIPRCQTTPGFIAGAKTYKLVFNGNGLFVIHLGDAMSLNYENIRPRGAVESVLSGAVINAMANGLGKKLAEEEQRLASIDLKSAVDDKKVFLVTPQNLEKFEISKNGYNMPTLDIKSGKLKAKLHFYYEEDKADLEKMAEKLIIK